VTDDSLGVKLSGKVLWRMLSVHWLVNVTPGPVCERFALDYPVGGAWLDVLRAEVARLRDVDLTVSFLADTSVEAFRDDDGVSYVPIRSSVQGPEALKRWLRRGVDADIVRVTRDAIDRTSADLVHVHGTERCFGVAAAQSEIPFVVSLQGILSVCERMYWRGLARHPLSWVRAKKVLARSDALQGWRDMKRRSAIEREILRACDGVLGRTDWDRRFARMVTPHAPYFHVGELIRPAFHDAAWHAKKAVTGMIYSTGGAAPYKGLETLIEALSILRCAGYDVRLRVGGSVAHSDLWRAANGIAGSLGVRANVHLLGPLPAESIAEELASCHVAAFASHADNSPNSVAEALMVGAPTVGTAVGGMSSLIENDVNGLLVQDGDPWAMAGAVAELMDDPERCRRFSENARHRARAIHSPQVVVGDLVHAYRAVIGAPAKKSAQGCEE